MSRGQRQQSGPPVTSVPALSSHQLSAVTDKVNRLLILSRVCSMELDFRTTGYPSATISTGPPHTGGIHLTRRSARNTLRGHRGVTRLLTFKDTSRFRFLPPSATRRSHSRWHL